VKREYVIFRVGLQVRGHLNNMFKAVQQDRGVAEISRPKQISKIERGAEISRSNHLSKIERVCRILVRGCRI